MTSTKKRAAKAATETTAEKKPRKKEQTAPAASASPARSPTEVGGAMFCGGPQRRSVFEGSFRATPQVLWAVEGPASSTCGGSVVVGDGIALGGDAVLHAVDARTGAPRWQTSTSTPYPSHACGSFHVVDGVAYGCFRFGLHAFSLADGKRLWLAKMKDPAWIGGAPLVVGDVAIAASERKGLQAFSIANGKKAWELFTEQPAGALVSCDDGVLYVHGARAVHAIALAGLEPIWTVGTDGWMSWGPIVGDDAVYTDLGFAHVARLDKATGAQRWTTELEEGLVIKGAALARDTLYFCTGRMWGNEGDGKLVALDAQTGAVRWTANGGRSHPNAGYRCPIVVGDVVIVVLVDEDLKGRLCGFDADSGALLWELRGEELCLDEESTDREATGWGGWDTRCTPFVADGILYAQTKVGLAALK
jgi:outer membrane protein assembly factor BamB